MRRLLLRRSSAWPSLLMLAIALAGCGKKAGAPSGDGGASTDGTSERGEAGDGEASDAAADRRNDGGEASTPVVPCNGICAGVCTGVCTGICSERTEDGECLGRCEEICVGSCQGTCTKLVRPDGGADRAADLAVDRIVDARAERPSDGSAASADVAVEPPDAEGGDAPVAEGSVVDAPVADGSVVDAPELGIGRWTDRTRVSTLSWPPAGHAGAVAFDSARGKMVMFGGGTAPGNATWEWDGADGTWLLRQQMAAPRPSRRYGHAMAYDPVRDKVILYGGIDETGGSNAETWEWDGETETWTMKGRGPTPSRWGHAMTFDSHSGRIVMFGGSYRHPTLGDGDLYDTWEYDGETDTWVNKTYPLPPSWPRGRRGHAMTFDHEREVTLMYGGESQTFGGALADLWEWDGEKAIWADRTNERASAWPGPRVLHGLVFAGTRTLLVGGPGPSLWEWNGDAGTWRTLTPVPLPSAWPTARSRVPMVWDSNRAALVLTGGSFAFGNEQLADTWEWAR